MKTRNVSILELAFLKKTSCIILFILTFLNCHKALAQKDWEANYSSPVLGLSTIAPNNIVASTTYLTEITSWTGSGTWYNHYAIEDAFSELVLDIDYENFDIGVSSGAVYTIDISVTTWPIGIVSGHKEYLGSPSTAPIILQLTFDNNSNIKNIDKVIKSFPSTVGLSAQITAIKLNGTPAPLPISNMIRLTSITRWKRYSVFNISPPLVNSLAVNSALLDLQYLGKTLLKASWIKNVPVTGYSDRQEWFEVEWTFIDFKDKAYIDGSTCTLNYDFRRNAVRIISLSDFYNIPVIYPEGFIVWRVRRVGYQLNSLSPSFPLAIKKGDWNIADYGALTFSSSTTSSDNFFKIAGLQTDKNWQAGITFAEKGMQKEVVSYYDNTLRQRQAVTRLNTTFNNNGTIIQPTVVAQTIYDKEGRPVIQTLPTPTKSHGSDGLNLEYKEEFVMSTATSAPYSWEDFDKDYDDKCAKSVTRPVDPNYGPGKYYSNNNDFDKSPSLNNDHNKLIPDAMLYPFTQVEYMSDNTGRIRRQGGVGIDHQLSGKTQYTLGANLGDNHETVFTYSKPGNGELYNLFGREVGVSEHYEKTVVKDPNGQLSVSLMDPSGKVIATSLAGAVPTNVNPLGATFVTLCEEPILSVPEMNLGEILLVANESFSIETASEHHLEYKLEAEPFKIKCDGEEQSLCYDCEYELTIVIKDACGQTIVPSDETLRDELGTTASVKLTKKTGEPEECNNLVFERTGDNSTNKIDLGQLPVGTYYVSKILRIKTDKADEYAKDAFEKMQTDGCKDTEEDFIGAIVVDNSPCDEITCEICQGQYDDLVTAFGLSTSENGMAISNGEQFQLNLKNDMCLPFCSNNLSPCKLLELQMLRDMEPGGQYATYMITTGADENKKTFSIFDDQFTIWDAISGTGNDFVTVNGYSIFDPDKTPVPWKNPEFKIGASTYNFYPNEIGGQVFVKWDGPASAITYKVNSTGGTWVSGDVYVEPQNLPSASDFIRLFKPTWARALLKYHAEYCYYEKCQELNEIYQDDVDMMNTTSIKEAIDKGYFNPFCNSGTTLTTIPTELVPTTGCFEDILKIMNKLSSSTVPSESYVVSQLTSYFNSTSYNGQNIYEYTRTLIDMQTGDCYTNDYWITFRGLYLDLKYKYLYQPLYAGLSACTTCVCPKTYMMQRRFYFEPTQELKDGGGGEMSQEEAKEINRNNSATNCDNKMALWREQMENCDQFGTGTTKEDRIDKLIDELMEVCVIGYEENEDNSFLNNSNTAVTLNGNKSFNEVFAWFQREENITFDEGCNPFILQFPDEEQEQQLNFMAPVDDCGCTNVQTVKTAFEAQLGDPDAICDIQEFMEKEYGWDIDIKEILCYCEYLANISNPNYIEDNHESPCYKTWTHGLEFEEQPCENGTNHIAKEIEQLLWGIKQKYCSVNTAGYIIFNPPLSTSINITDIFPGFYSSDLYDPARMTCSLKVVISKILAPTTQPWDSWEIEFTDSCGFNCKISLRMPYGGILYDFWENAQKFDIKIFSGHIYIDNGHAYDDGLLAEFSLGNCFPTILCCGADDEMVYAAINNAISSIVDDNYYVFPDRTIGGLKPGGIWQGSLSLYTTLNSLYTKFMNPCPTLEFNFPPSGVPPGLIHIYAMSPCSSWDCSVENPTFTNEEWFIFPCGPDYSLCPKTYSIPYMPVELTCEKCVNCTTLTTFRGEFDDYLNENFDSIALTEFQYYEELAKYINKQLHTNFTSGDMILLWANCQEDPNLLLDPQPDPPLVVWDSEKCYEIPTYLKTPCEDEIMGMAILNAKNLYRIYMGKEIETIKQEYILHCQATVEELFKHDYPNDANQVTLYFYDRVGNLTKTVPPEGVDQNPPVLGYKSHELITRYEYNSLNQVEQQFTPDAGITNFWYDWAGRLVASQNAKQADLSSTYNNIYSYTLYDEQGRIKEVGEVGCSSAITTLDLRDDVIEDGNVQVFLNWVEAGSRSQITRTMYDNADHLSDAVLDRFRENTPMHLRNRVASTLYFPTLSSYTSATHFSYDIHGNVDEMIQEIPELASVGNVEGGEHRRQDLKKIEYEYDLISGNVNKVIYQPRYYWDMNLPLGIDPKWITFEDDFYHKYTYDADNRLLNAQTSTDDIHYEQDANYNYYLHGPLARTELGDIRVQGLDYAYTIQGWLKAMNGSLLNAPNDMGRDAEITPGNTRQRVARDAAAFSLHYYEEDFHSVGYGLQGIDPFLISNSGIAGSELFNGNIMAMNTALPDKTSYSGTFTITQSVLTQGYQYDQLNRIAAARSFVPGSTPQTIVGTANPNVYRSDYTYDKNGNINTLMRYDQSGTRFDSLVYFYNTSLHNRLLYVNEESPSAATNDIEDQAAGNYTYDKIGNLTSDAVENIDAITWNVYGKIESVSHSGGGMDLNFDYDPAGNRIMKEVITSGNSVKTYYIRDAQGNIMATYTHISDYFTWQSSSIYGSSRIGVYNANATLVDAGGPIMPPPVTNISFKRGLKHYEIANHLGNVLSVITDRKIGKSGPTMVFDPDIVSFTDYYPFGMVMKERSWQATSIDKYRFGMNGQEKDDEIYGEGNSTSAEYWQYDCRLGRRWNVDPIIKVFESSYSCFNNNPIAVADIKGADGEIDSKDGKVKATIFVKFDDDANLTTAEKTTYLDALRKDIQGTWGSYSLPNGVVVDASTLVVSEAPENVKLKENENLITVGYGENDNNDYTRSRQISHIHGINNNKGYFYLKNGQYQDEGDHEFGHMLGLADRYHEALELENSSTWKFGERSTVPMHLNDPGYDPQNNLMSGVGTGLTKSQFEVVTKRGSKEKSFTTALIIIDDVFIRSKYDAVEVTRIHGVTTVKGYSGGLMDNRQTPSWAWRKNHGGKNDAHFFGFADGRTMNWIPNHATIIEHNKNVVKDIMKFTK